MKQTQIRSRLNLSNNHDPNPSPREISISRRRKKTYFVQPPVRGNLVHAVITTGHLRTPAERIHTTNVSVPSGAGTRVYGYCGHSRFCGAALQRRGPLRWDPLRGGPLRGGPLRCGPSAVRSSCGAALYAVRPICGAALCRGAGPAPVGRGPLPAVRPSTVRRPSARRLHGGDDAGRVRGGRRQVAWLVAVTLNRGKPRTGGGDRPPHGVGGE